MFTPNQITQWKGQLLEQASTVFEQGTAAKEPPVDIKTLHAKIGERKAMINRNHPLPISKQAKAVGISRGSVYYLPRPASDYDQELMRRIDHLHPGLPFAGSRMLRVSTETGRILHRAEACGNADKAYGGSKPRPGAGLKIYPYLLRNLSIDRPNQVWAVDITYIPMARGFVYLAAVLDWHIRRVLSWKVSITMDVHFCLEAVEEAIETTKHRRSRTPTKAVNLPHRR